MLLAEVLCHQLTPLLRPCVTSTPCWYDAPVLPALTEETVFCSIPFTVCIRRIICRKAWRNGMKSSCESCFLDAFLHYYHPWTSLPLGPLLPCFPKKKKKKARILLNNLISFCCWCPQRLVLSSGGHCQLFFSMEKKLRLSPSLLKSKSKDCKESCDAPRLTAVGNVFLPGGLNQELLLAFWFVVSFHSLFYPSCHFQSRGWFFMHRP